MPMKNVQYKKDEKIALNDISVAAWAKKLKCESNDLWQAVLTVGPVVNNVLAFLQMNRKIKDDDYGI
ncbi:MAG: hypothetical protein K0S33_3480 [Bacteroidetes bacterium]|nr:hypothetical protein [Bacteroidota bacterium]